MYLQRKKCTNERTMTFLYRLKQDSQDAKSPNSKPLCLASRHLYHILSLIEVNALLLRDINRSTTEASLLLLVLLLGEALALGDNQILMSTLGVRHGDVGVGCEPGIDLDVFGDAREGLVGLLALQGGVGWQWGVVECGGGVGAVLL